MSWLRRYVRKPQSKGSAQGLGIVTVPRRNSAVHHIRSFLLLPYRWVPCALGSPLLARACSPGNGTRRSQRKAACELASWPLDFVDRRRMADRRALHSAPFGFFVRSFATEVVGCYASDRSLSNMNGFITCCPHGRPECLIKTVAEEGQ